jgi:hypothetical protein
LVTRENLETVQDQKWFQRAWGTIAGQNKKLAQKNQANLLRVQEDALFFLENLATSNQTTSAMAVDALRRIEKVQVGSVKLKKYLSELTKKSARRFRTIEERISKHERAIMLHQLEQTPLILLAVAVILIAIAILILRLGNDAYHRSTALVLGDCGVLAGMGTAYAWWQSSRRAGRSITQTVEPIRTSPDDAQIRERVVDAMRQALWAYAEEHACNCVCDEYVSRFNSAVEVMEAWKEDSDNQTRVAVIAQVLELEPTPLDEITSMVEMVAKRFCDHQRARVASLATTCLPDSMGLDELAGLDDEAEASLKKDLWETIAPYVDKCERLEELRTSLQNRLERCGTLMKESTLKTVFKGMLEGANWRLFYRGATEDEEFLNCYFGDFGDYLQQWEDLTLVVDNSVRELHHRALFAFAALGASQLDALLEDCREAGVSGSRVLRQIERWSQRE